jgi:hypothetical protein
MREFFVMAMAMATTSIFAGMIGGSARTVLNKVFSSAGTRLKVTQRDSS